ncbi:hypothetical protein E1B28_011846 [Marasmius oreades]|uniref:Uncharacterized protein n=1 Tax=Marasmius oreades TaxID=181124 RepID=A0A9P7RVK4_9AGAR|nr:uncharacterized protein E1B28_011846 [Marasmius oreades]KAG7090248.1 hypothetical protein E1B28_011846 [Marasmius oreades]
MYYPISGPPYGQFLPLRTVSPSLPASRSLETTTTAMSVSQPPKQKERDQPDPSNIIEGSAKHCHKPTSKVLELGSFGLD